MDSKGNVRKCWEMPQFPMIIMMRWLQNKEKRRRRIIHEKRAKKSRIHMMRSWIMAIGVSHEWRRNSTWDTSSSSTSSSWRERESWRSLSCLLSLTDRKRGKEREREREWFKLNKTNQLLMIYMLPSIKAVLVNVSFLSPFLSPLYIIMSQNVKK